MDSELNTLLSNLDINSQQPSILNAPYRHISLKNNDLFLSMVENRTFLSKSDILFILNSTDNEYYSYDLIFLGFLLENIYHIRNTYNAHNTYNDILHISLMIVSKFKETNSIANEIISLIQLIEDQTELNNSIKIHINDVLNKVYDIIIYISCDHTDKIYLGELNYFTNLYNIYMG